jgi:hypothetical protein
MKMLEILLPKNLRDKDLSPRKAERIGLLQKKIDQCVDKILDPATSRNGKDFLKQQLQTHYDEFKKEIGSFHRVAEDSENNSNQYEVYDHRTGERVSGPYSNAKRARTAREKKDLAHGAVRYGVRPVKKISEAVHRLPLSNNDFDALKEMMNKPIPATIASIYIQDLIVDDEFTDQLNALSEENPGMDIRPFIVEWIDRVMPDQKFRFVNQFTHKDQREGKLSPIHGYDPQSYKGTNDPITGNAYGSR